MRYARSRDGPARTFFLTGQNLSLLNGGAFSEGLALVAVAAALATLFPARRAIRVDPSETLRADT